MIFSFYHSQQVSDLGGPLNKVKKLEHRLFWYFTASPRVRRQLEPGLISDAEGLCRKTFLPDVRLCGGESSNEGFIQMFNSTINAWSLVCDPQFNDRTAEVGNSLTSYSVGGRES